MAWLSTTNVFDMNAALRAGAPAKCQAEPRVTPRLGWHTHCELRDSQGRGTREAGSPRA